MPHSLGYPDPPWASPVDAPGEAIAGQAKVGFTQDSQSFLWSISQMQLVKVLRDYHESRVALDTFFKNAELAECSIEAEPEVAIESPAPINDFRNDIEPGNLAIATQLEAIKISGHFPSPRHSWFKKPIRKIAKSAYRPFKYFILPAASRLRRYLLENLSNQLASCHAQLDQRIDQRHAQLVQQIMQSHAELDQQIKQNHAHLDQRIDQSHSQLSQQIKQNQGQLEQRIDQSHSQLSQQIKQNQGQLEQQFHPAYLNVLNTLKEYHDSLAIKLSVVTDYTGCIARRIAINCDGGELLIRTSVGFLLCGAADHALVACLLDTGELELGTRLLIQRYLRSGDVYIDVGANIGMHTLAAAQAMDGKGKIIAFEPFEATAHMLQKSMWMNGFSTITEIHQAAVSNVTGRQHLFIGMTSGHHSLISLDPLSGHVGESVEVPVVRLDEVLASSQHIDLIKIDAEGSELAVIEGAISLIKNNPNIALIVEFGPSHLQRTGHTSTQWFNAFSALGLDCMVINAGTGLLESMPMEDISKVESANLFFAKENSLAWRRLK